MSEQTPRTMMPGPILVTCFEAFAPPGKRLRPENESEEVLRVFGDRNAHRSPVPGPGTGAGRCDLLILPVDPRCEVQLARALHRNPSGVVAMGEAGLDGSWDTNVEVRAWDRPILTERAAGRPPRTPSEAFFSSPFAASLPLLPGMEREERIGSYWCNRAYYRILEWCIRFERPAVFLHLRVGSDRTNHVAHLEHALGIMARGIPAHA